MRSLRPYSLVGANHRRHFIFRKHRIPAPERDFATIVGNTFAQVHIPAVWVGHQVPATIEAIQFPYDFAILCTGRFTEYQRLSLCRTVPESTSRIGIATRKGTILPIITHGITFIPPIEAGVVIPFHRGTVKRRERHHLPAFRAHLNFRSDFKVTLESNSLLLVVQGQFHLKLAHGRRRHFPGATLDDIVRNHRIDNNSVFSSHHHTDDRFGIRIFRIESQANGVTGLFNFRLHQLEFAPAAGTFGRAGAFFGTRGTRFHDFAAGTTFGTGGFTAGARHRSLAAGAFNRSRRRGDKFIAGHDFGILLDFAKIAIPTDKGIPFMFRGFRRNRCSTIFHPQGIPNRRFVIVNKDDRVFYLG